MAEVSAIEKIKFEIVRYLSPGSWNACRAEICLKAYCKIAARQDKGSAEQTSAEQLKAEIRAMLSNRVAMSTVEFYAWIDSRSERLRELSAV